MALPIPSLAMIPSGYKESKIYSVYPTTGVGDFTFNRNSSATRIAKNGLITSVATDIPRLDYSNGSCPSLLLEPQSTNQITESQVFAGYTENNAVLVDNVITSPDGTLNGASFTDDNTGGTGIVQMLSAETVDVSSTYTWSIFAKKKGVNYIIFRPNAFTTPANFNSSFNLENGTVRSEGTGHTAKIEDYGSGWYRCSVTFTTDAVDTDGSLILRLSTTGSDTTLNLDGTNSIYTWGWQFEKKPITTSYIPTTGSAVTRDEDDAIDAGSSTVFNDSEGVLYAEIAAIADADGNRIISISDGTSSNRVTVQYSSVSNQMKASVSSAGVVTVSEVFVVTDVFDFHKIAIKYKLNDFALWIDGVERGTDVSGAIPIGLSELTFDNGNGASKFKGKCKDLRVYNTALTDSELAILTTI